MKFQIDKFKFKKTTYAHGFLVFLYKQMNTTYDES